MPTAESAFRRAQSLDELFQRLATMTGCVLLVRIELRSSTTERRQEEVGIVTESIRPPGVLDHLTVPTAFRNEGLRVIRMSHQNNDAVVMCPAVAVSLKGGKELLGVEPILHLTRGLPPLPRITCIARGMDARLTGQRLNTDPRIICERWHARVCARVSRFGERILDERLVRLFGVGDAQTRLRHDLDA